ncbi:hypothetical protein LOCC1_G007830 [Lachnellula occidentalis]|uniref:Zn(2)-C6 fungal-type domain-containing protein n=1 Tax=Lachnellula occidentalis TaxID=215460 RepID=A0A8H8U6B0_9HELO|nr:hypothetical protein LOCC1_G007830 [Lachnellula occidentalis]
MPETPSATSIRSTQRPPRSCKTCARRRVRCDRKIPCRGCVSRGLELTCERETVRVKGRRWRRDRQQSPPTYQDLLEENRRLKAEIAGRNVSSLISTEEGVYGEALNITESFERDLFEAVGGTSRASTVDSEEQAALIFMNEEEAEAAGIKQPRRFPPQMGCAHRASDCDSRHRVHQRRGLDSTMQSVLWACAIRIAQFLNMGNDRAHQHESLLRTETRRRLWWTLVICEWIPIPYHAPCISTADFQIELPARLDDEELLAERRQDDLPRPIEYHIVMIQLAKIYHRFRSSLNLLSGKAAEIVTLVLQTDEALADNIAGLPSHLHFGIPSSSALIGFFKTNGYRTPLRLHALVRYVWILRVGLSRWLLLVRILWLGIDLGLPAANKNQYRATSLHLFSAAIILGVEARFHADESKQQYVQDMQFCVTFLNGVKDQSIIAPHAVQILEEQFPDERGVQ